MPDPAAIVLAGGASRRMGTDKAILVVDGRRLIDRVVDEVVAAGITDIVVAGPDPGGLADDVRVIADAAVDRLGPLAGVSAAWGLLAGAAVPPDPVLVLSCDLPRLDRRVLVELVERAGNDPVGAAAHDGKRLQPLVAAYRPATIRALQAAFADGARSISLVIDGCGPAVVPFDPEVLADVDTPGDLADHGVDWPDRR